MLKPIGYQDHYAAAYGGFNKIIFKKNEVIVKKINISKKNSKSLFEYLMLIWSKFKGTHLLYSKIKKKT